MKHLDEEIRESISQAIGDYKIQKEDYIAELRKDSAEIKSNDQEYDCDCEPDCDCKEPGCDCEIDHTCEDEEDEEEEGCPICGRFSCSGWSC